MSVCIVHPDTAAREQREIVYDIICILSAHAATPHELEMMVHISSQVRRTVIGKLVKSKAVRVFTCEYTQMKRYGLTHRFRVGEITEEMLLGAV